MQKELIKENAIYTTRKIHLDDLKPAISEKLYAVLNLTNDEHGFITDISENAGNFSHTEIHDSILESWLENNDKEEKETELRELLAFMQEEKIDLIINF